MEFLAHRGKRAKKQTDILVSQLVAGTIEQGSPTLRPWTGTVGGGQRVSKCSLSVFIATAHHLRCCLNSPHVRFCIGVSCIIISLYVTTPGGEKGNPPQYSGLENSLDCIVQGVAKSQTGLSNFHIYHNVIIIEIK